MSASLGMRLSQRLRGIPFRLANFAVHVLLWPLQRYRVMIYAVLRKRAG